MPITRYFGMAPESSYNEAWGSPTLVYTDIAEESISGEPNRESLPTMTFPGPTRAVTGNYGISGPINTVAETDLLGHLLKAAIGQCSTQQEIGWSAYQHIFHTMSPRGGVSKLPSYKYALGEDLLSEKRFTGVYLPNIEFTFNTGEPCRVVAQNIAALETLATFSAPAVADHPADSEYVFHMNRLRGWVGSSGGTQKEFGASGGAQAFEQLVLTINTNPTDDWYKAGSQFLHDFFMQEQEITGSLRFSFEDIEEAKRFYEGGEAPTATTPQDRVDTFPLIFSCDLGFLVDTDPGGSELNYRLLFYLPKAFYTSYSKPQARRERATVDVAFKALIPMTAPDLDAETYDSGSKKVAFVEDSSFTDSTESNRDNSALYAVLHNAISSYA